MNSADVAAQIDRFDALWSQVYREVYRLADTWDALSPDDERAFRALGDQWGAFTSRWDADTLGATRADTYVAEAKAFYLRLQHWRDVVKARGGRFVEPEPPDPTPATANDPWGVDRAIEGATGIVRWITAAGVVVVVGGCLVYVAARRHGV